MDNVSDDAEVFCGVLEILGHHARNIHNICIYDNQDVYAKFCLTCSPEEALSTRIVNGGGKNPEFNEELMLKMTHLEAVVLKCEIWMLSRAREVMEDQLLGFALVPISQVVRRGKVTHDYTLSSTDLFHCPAGTVNLTLTLHESKKAVMFSSEEEQCAAIAMQQQIVEMYTRSMQQFTESLAQMKQQLPMGHVVDKQAHQTQNNGNKLEAETKKQEERSRVFYGSRAFY